MSNIFLFDFYFSTDKICLAPEKIYFPILFRIFLGCVWYLPLNKGSPGELERKVENGFAQQRRRSNWVCKSTA